MTNNNRSPQEIERDIERERAGLTDTLDELQDKFSVETMARQFSDQFREHGGELGRSVTEAVKRNPIALAVTGAGLAWLMLGNGSDGNRRRVSRSRDRSYRDDRYDRYDENFQIGDGDHSARRGDNSNPRGKPLGPLPSGTPGDPRYRTDAHRSASANYPSWARSDDDANSGGTFSGVGKAVSGAKDKVTGAASATADKARHTGEAISDGAADATGRVSDAGRSVADGARNLAASASDRAAALRKRLSEGTEHLSEDARERVVAARERAVEAQRAAANYARKGRDRASDAFEDQPLVAGALAVALGAAVAAALPRSRMEDDYLGEHSDNLINEAERVFAEEKQKLGNVAQAATDEAKKVVSDAKDEVGNAARTAADKAKASGERVADAAQAEAKKQHVGDLKTS